MERIKPIPRMGFMMKNGKVTETGVISELGPIGYFLAKKSEIIKNDVGGYLVRTKVIKWLVYI